MAENGVKRNENTSARDEALGNQRLDYLVTALKGVASAVPFGSLVVETVTSVIPRQRMDRVADMIGRLGAKLDEVEADVKDVKERFSSPEFIDLFEEGVLQAGKALSEERRQHIANILFHGLTDEDLNHARVKKLLFLLNDLADPEIVWLTYVNLAMDESQEQFYQVHEKVLAVVEAVIGSDRGTLDEAALQESYKNRLVQLGLASERMASANDVTPLGRMLLRYIDAPRDCDVEEEDATGEGNE